MSIRRWLRRWFVRRTYFTGIDTADGVDTTVTVYRDSDDVFHVVKVERRASFRDTGSGDRDAVTPERTP